MISEDEIARAKIVTEQLLSVLAPFRAVIHAGGDQLPITTSYTQSKESSPVSSKEGGPNGGEGGPNNPPTPGVDGVSSGPGGNTPNTPSSGTTVSGRMYEPMGQMFLPWIC